MPFQSNELFQVNVVIPMPPADVIAVWIVGGRAALPGADAVLVWPLRLCSRLHESITEAQADQCGNLAGSV